MTSTPLQELIASIWALVPGLIPYLALAWAAAAVAAIVSLLLDERSGDRTPRSSWRAAWLAVRVGVVLTLMVFASEARAKGLISKNALGVLGGVSVAFGFSMSKRHKTTLDVQTGRQG
jgi:hypothetical protein